ncbi:MULTISPECIES: hypothetical protein [unclassified Thioalkalivibrio]|uniref:hypothetical protein n=1 Tax=unclassified Thioalkalivibrio TaxID=2621013 RepID=UPI00036D4186|nr:MULTISPECIES: hypothetical protein [unclassified Thioalkalivibrio]
MRHLLIAAGAGLLLATGCASNETRSTDSTESADTAGQAEAPATTAADVPADAPVIRVAHSVPYSDDATIANNIRQECNLEEQFSEFIAHYGADQGIRFERRQDVGPSAGGQVLMVELTDAVSGGNAWIGHRKVTEAAGTLYADGEEQASFTSRRFSGGGAFGGFKGSCSVLGRTVQAMGRDIATWSAAPADGAHLGD